MSRRGVSAIGLATLALGFCGTAQGGDEWERLQRLRPGDQIRVELRGKPAAGGDFAAVTQDGLQIAAGNEQLDFSRAEIRRVYLVRPRSRARAAAPLIGALVGVGVGIAAGYALGETGYGWGPQIFTKPVTAAIGGTAFGGTGALVGFLVAGKSESVVYRAR